MRRGGFTLIECLIGLALSLFVITAGLEFLARAQRAFLRLKAKEEAGQAALAALDRMRVDLLHAGRGLVAEIEAGLVVGAEADAAELRTTSLERPLALAAAVSAGETRLRLDSTAEIAAGQRLALRVGPAGEVRTIVGVETDAVLVEAPLERGYAPGSSVLSLLETVAYFLDGRARVLRRRVNASPAQPLLEDAAAAVWSLDPDARLVRVRLELTIEGAQPHETTVFLKNPALAGIR